MQRVLEFGLERLDIERFVAFTYRRLGGDVELFLGELIVANGEMGVSVFGEPADGEAALVIGVGGGGPVRGGRIREAHADAHGFPRAKRDRYQLNADPLGGTACWSQELALDLHLWAQRDGNGILRVSEEFPAYAVARSRGDQQHFWILP